MSLIALPG